MMNANRFMSRQGMRSAVLGMGLIALMCVWPGNAAARQHRSAQTKHAFQRAHPCPSTGKRVGKCPGYIIDHRIALCVGGRDEVANMRWQTFDQSILKDRWECRRGWQGHLALCEASGCFVN